MIRTLSIGVVLVLLFSAVITYFSLSPCARAQIIPIRRAAGSPCAGGADGDFVINNSATNNAGHPNDIFVSYVDAGDTGCLKSITCYIGGLLSSGNDVNLVVFGDNGSGTAPDDFIAETGACQSGAPLGDITCDFEGIPVETTTNIIWAGVAQEDAGGINIYHTSSGGTGYQSLETGSGTSNLDLSTNCSGGWPCSGTDSSNSRDMRCTVTFDDSQ